VQALEHRGWRAGPLLDLFVRAHRHDAQGHRSPQGGDAGAGAFVKIIFWKRGRYGGGRGLQACPGLADPRGCAFVHARHDAGAARCWSAWTDVKTSSGDENTCHRCRRGHC